MKHRRILSGLAALMLAASLPMSALAREWDIADGDITIVADNDGQKVSQGTENDISDDNPIIIGNSATNTVSIVAEKDQTANVTLSGANIDGSTKGNAAVSTTGEGNVSIELDGDSTLKSGFCHAGLEKNNGGSLTIADEDKNGKLTAEGGGYGAGIGGVVIDAGTFNWRNPKFALYNEPDRGYHGLRFAHDLPLNLAFILRLRTVGLRNQGPTLAPDAAWIFLQGVESLPLRAAKHSSNALKVAEFLAHHPKVAWVRYPSLTEPELAKKYLPDGAGGMVVFGVKGGSAEARKLVDAVPLFSILANVGDAKSLIIHPASTTHSQVSDEEQRKQGLQPELIRLSIGLEHPDDILAALSEGLDAIG